jgi:CRP/FNR family cyclic AMP-dependent transcriptional regulator
MAGIMPNHSAFRKQNAAIFSIEITKGFFLPSPQPRGEFLIEPAGRNRFNGLIPMSARKFAADKLLWETLGRWKRSGSESDRIQFLKTVPFFDRLSKRQLKTVSDIMFERTYDTDESIFEEGQPGAALFLILDGKVAIEIYRESSTTRLAVLERGAFFGEMALLDETPRSATARALEPTRTLALYRNDLNGLRHRHARTACQIYRSLATMIGDRLRATNELVQMKTPADTAGLE